MKYTLVSPWLKQAVAMCVTACVAYDLNSISSYKKFYDSIWKNKTEKRGLIEIQLNELSWTLITQTSCGHVQYWFCSMWFLLNIFL